MTPADTPYRTLDVSRQYDGWSDWPQFTGDSTQNWSAAMNALAGQSSVHPRYDLASLDDPTNMQFVEGNTTYILCPTHPAPAGTP